MELSVFQIIWIASGSVLVIGWLVVSFAPPSRNRTIIEWLSVTAMYAAILTIFVSLALRAHATGHDFVVWAIALLCVLFGGAFPPRRPPEAPSRRTGPPTLHACLRPYGSP